MADLWAAWLQAWNDAASRLSARGYTVTAVRVDPPASEATLVRVETQLGHTFPTDLRRVLTEHASAVHFGWSIPRERRPHALPGPTSGGLRGVVFGLEAIERAWRNFESWRAELATRKGGEQPNTPSMWKAQFPIAELVNGDMLTIDCSSEKRQPVRYFSHELEGLHGREIAPDWPSFVTEYSKLACAGVEHSDWFRFCDDDGKRAHLRADSPGGVAWLAFLAADDDGAPDVPAEQRNARLHALVVDGPRHMAPADYLAALDALLEAGADPNAPWDNDIRMLMKCGPKTAERLLAYGADPLARDAMGRTAIHGAESAGALRLMLDRGVDPNVMTTPPKGRYELPPHTPLHAHLADYYDPRHTERVALLLEAGADPNRRDGAGAPPLFYANHAADLALLLEAGVDVGAIDDKGQRALHWVARYTSGRIDAGYAKALVNAGYDLKARDGSGKTVLQLVVKAPDVANMLRALGV